MRLATARVDGATRAVRVQGDGCIDLGQPDLGAFLALPDWRSLAERADGPVVASTDAKLALLVPKPGKIVCVGLNYRTHIIEMGRDLPVHPTLFAKFTESLVGPTDDIVMPSESHCLDWEAELAIVIGDTVRRADESRAGEAIAGFTAMSDVTLRDWQYRTPQWLQGKTFEHTTPLGPILTTPDELAGGTKPRLAISTSVNGEVEQASSTADLVFDPVALVQYVSSIVTLRPGDVIATGTPGGVGHAHTPPRYLKVGDMLVTEIEGIGRLENRVVS